MVTSRDGPTMRPLVEDVDETAHRQLDNVGEVGTGSLELSLKDSGTSKLLV